MTAVMDQSRRFKISQFAITPNRVHTIFLFALRPLNELAAGLGTRSAALRALVDLGGEALEQFVH